MEKDEFENPCNAALSNRYYFVKDGKKIVYDNNRKTEWDAEDAPAEAETMICKSLEIHTYVRKLLTAACTTNL